MKSIEIIALNENNHTLLEDLIAEKGFNNPAFRYFESRSIKVLENHILTVVLQVSQQSCGYLHLDREGDTIWLGINILPDFQGYGLSKILVEYALSFSKLNEINEITLAVDKTNNVAQSLYKRLGFVQNSEIEHAIFMKKSLHK